jgi:hypothetical protein
MTIENPNQHNLDNVRVSDADELVSPSCVI